MWKLKNQEIISGRSLGSPVSNIELYINDYVDILLVALKNDLLLKISEYNVSPEF